MLDIGNFLLVNHNSTNLWESFKEPTDTLLPTQTLVRGMKLVARYSETNYSRGRFQLVLQSNGDLELYTVAFPFDTPNFAYWVESSLKSGSALTFDQYGSLYLEAPKQDFYQRAILEYDGVFRQ